MVPVPDPDNIWEEEDEEENLNGTWLSLFFFFSPERKIAEDMVPFLAGSISCCERKQGGERKCKQILMLHLRSGYNFRFLGSPLVSSAASIPKPPARKEYQEDGWPQVLVLFIFIKVGWSAAV